MSEEERNLEVELEEEETTSQDTFSIEGLAPQEIDMAKEQGLYKEPEEEEEDEHEEQPESESEEDSGDKEKEREESEEEINSDPDNFEEIDKVYEKNEKKFHEKFTPNQKALYFKAKADKQRRQEAVKEAEELRAKLKELDGTKVSKKKLDQIAKLLDEDADNLTIEALQKIVNEKVEEEKEGPVKPELIAEKVNTKAKFAEKIGNAKYENFREIATLAGEMAQEHPIYQELIDKAFLDDNVDESLLVEQIVSIAKLSPKFKDLGKDLDKETKEKVDRVLKNSKKKVSSASVSSSGKRTISEDELTCDEAVKLPISKWEKLSKKTKERILMGIDP